MTRTASWYATPSSSAATCQFGPLPRGFIGSILTASKCRLSPGRRHNLRHSASSHAADFSGIKGRAHRVQLQSRSSKGGVNARRSGMRCFTELINWAWAGTTNPDSSRRRLVTDTGDARLGAKCVGVDIRCAASASSWISGRCLFSIAHRRYTADKLGLRYPIEVAVFPVQISEIRRHRHRTSGRSGDDRLRG
jgi:hypothetical protein